MILQNWWFTTLLNRQYASIEPLKKDIKADVLIVGGGMSGISAAAAFMGKGLKVVLIERNILGGSSTGKSAGFLTPDSELELSQLIRRYGVDGAKELWQVPLHGIDLITSYIKQYDLKCDFITQDSLFVGIGSSGTDAIQDEAKSRAATGMESIVYDDAQLKQVLGAVDYTAAVRYKNTYGMSALQYAQSMKEVLIAAGIEIYEATSALRIEDHTVYTHAGSVTADKIIISMDKMERNFSHFSDEVFHAQTFLSISEPLSDNELHKLFPSGEQFQCWDSTLVYSYYRLTGDNRLLLGGGSAFTTFLDQPLNSSIVINNVIKDFKKHFPDLNDLEFVQYWPGLIDTTKDLLPTVVRDPQAPHLHFILGVVGLPWASFCGDFLARVILGTAGEDEQKYFEYFSERRHFLLPNWLEHVIGKPLEFSLNNAFAKYKQVDTDDQVKFDAKDF